MLRITLERKEEARMRRLTLGLSLAFALIGVVRLVNPNAGAKPCSGPGCFTRSWWAAKDDSAKTDLAKGNDAKSDLAKDGDAKADLAKGDDAKSDLAKGDSDAKTDLGGRL